MNMKRPLVRKKNRKIDISPIRGNSDHEIEKSSGTDAISSSTVESDRFVYRNNHEYRPSRNSSLFCSGPRRNRNSQLFLQPPSPQTRLSSMDVLEEENIKEV